MKTEDIKKAVEEFIGKIPCKIDSIETIEVDGRAPVFVIKTTDSGMLIGTNGVHFQALSLLIKKVVAAKAKAQGVDEPKFFVDVNDYRAGMAEHITTKAGVLAERARSLRADIEMEPMNPYERLIVHEFLANAPQVKTESIGEGKDRRVIIRFVEKTNDAAF